MDANKVDKVEVDVNTSVVNLTFTVEVNGLFVVTNIVIVFVIFNVAVDNRNHCWSQ